MMKESSKDAWFVRTYLILGWNLMSRANNVSSIRYVYMDWKDDASKIFFAQQKTDQSGTRKAEGRHLYANPIDPEICPVLSFGLFWTSTDFNTDNDSLFKGQNQYERFRKGFDKYLNTAQVKLELFRRGHLQLDRNTPKDRVRRHEELAWRTVLKELRKKNRV